MQGSAINNNMLKHRSVVVFFLLCFTFAFAQSAFAQDEDAQAKAARDQAQKLYQTFKNKDWKGLYDLIQLSPSVAKQLNGRDAFAKDFETGLKQGDPTDNLGKVVDNMSDIRTGAAIVEGKYAYVSCTSVVVIEGTKMRFLGMVKLIKVGDSWRWDLSFTDDPEKASAQRFSEMLGLPAVDKG